LARRETKTSAAFSSSKSFSGGLTFDRVEHRFAPFTVRGKLTRVGGGEKTGEMDWSPEVMRKTTTIGKQSPTKITHARHVLRVWSSRESLL